jgi:hypothetical protein
MQRQSERDVRMHEPPTHSHPHAILTHPTQPHINGNAAALPTTPALSNGSHTASNQIVSPVVIPNAPTSNGVAPQPSSVIHKLAVANEQTWLLIGKRSFFIKKKNRLISLTLFPGRVAEQMGDLEHAITAYENALRHNPMSLSGLTQVAGIARIKENYPKVGKIVDAISCQYQVPCRCPPRISSPIRLRPRSSRGRGLMSSYFYFRQSSISNVFFNYKKTTAKYGAHSVSSSYLTYPYVLIAFVLLQAIVISCRMICRRLTPLISRLCTSSLIRRFVS